LFAIELFAVPSELSVAAFTLSRKEQIDLEKLNRNNKKKKVVAVR